FLLFEMPIDEVTDIAFTPISISGYSGRSTIKRSISCPFVSTLTSLDSSQYSIRIFRMATSVAVSSPLHMQEMVHTVKLPFRHFFVFCIHSTIPTCPNRGGVNIYNVFTEIATTDSRLS